MTALGESMTQARNGFSGDLCYYPVLDGANKLNPYLGLSVSVVDPDTLHYSLTLELPL